MSRAILELIFEETRISSLKKGYKSYRIIHIYTYMYIYVYIYIDIINVIYDT